MLKTNQTDNARMNHLLEALPAEVFNRLLPNLELISLPFGKVLYESGEQLDYVYFPTTAIIYLNYISENGSTVEIGVTGNDGVVGIALYMGGNTTPNRAVVQSAGNAFRIRAKLLLLEFGRGGVFQRILLLYAQYLMTQISQTAVCNRLHSIKQQLCRLLIFNHYLLQSNKLLMTHDLIGNMIGVRREGVSLAAIDLQNAGLIKYSRGIIKILDSNRLKNAACECYQVVKDEYARLFGKYISNSHQSKSISYKNQQFSVWKKIKKDVIYLDA